MPKCVECKYEGKYFILDVPFPIASVMAAKLGAPNADVVDIHLVGFEGDMKKYGFTNKNDLANKGMKCQAPSGGPTSDPIVLIQALADQPCNYFAPKDIDYHVEQKTTTSDGVGQNKNKSDYSFVHDANQKVVGMWFRDPAQATPEMVATALEWKQIVSSPEQLAEIMLKCRNVPNNFDNAGGCFVMFGTMLAPGEKARLKENRAVTTNQYSQPIQTATSASHKSPILAAVLSFFLLGGAGQLYLGQWKKGLTLILATLLLSGFFIGIPIGIIGIGDAYGTAQRLSSGDAIGEWKFNVNWKVAGLVTIIYAISICGILLLGSLNPSK